jgi:L-ascorbate metabolism protein UlaG (beta-lactamase superfamily)
LFPAFAIVVNKYCIFFYKFKMKLNFRKGLLLFITLVIPLCAGVSEKETNKENNPFTSDHFDGKKYFNPFSFASPVQSESGQQQSNRNSWLWRIVFGTDLPEWPDLDDDKSDTHIPPVIKAENGEIHIALVNHSTFLIQMDGLNILTDPVWSKRVGPLSWAGVKRHRKPGIRFEDLPRIDVVLVSHNHYDHMDLPTLERLAEKFHPSAFTPLGNLENLLDAGLESARELDWWQSVRISENVTVTLVPAQHFSMRSLWDRDETLWGGFVVSGPSGNVYFAGDTGYGTHFKEIARRFSPIKIALIPIAPFHQPGPGEENSPNFARVHLGPAEAVIAHIELGSQLSFACHFQTFQLGAEEYNSAPKALDSAIAKQGLKPDAFKILVYGQSMKVDSQKNLKAKR